ncbi:MAG: IclR family transcriptional regulator [Deferribacterales bacterium]|nr:IclR family transcriptional regulator [Deferribacterales bacterium]
MRGLKPKVKREKAEYAVQAVRNAIDILELLGEYEHELSISEITSKLSLTKSNTNKLLSNLERFGYVEHNRYTGNFRLGVKIFQISQAYINKLNLIEISMQVMQRLKNLLNESVYVGVLRKDNVVYLDVIETDEAVRVYPRIGNVGPAYATAMGKIQLALLDEKDVDTFYEGKDFEPFTKNTVKSLKELKMQLSVAKQTGYAVDLEEYEEGVCCVAAPVLNFMGNVIAGISISAPKERMSKDRIEREIVPALIAEAKTLSVKFGFSS